MKNSLKAVAALSLVTTLAMPVAFANTNHNNTNNSGINVQKLVQVTSQDGLRPKVLKEALNGYIWAKKHHDIGANKNTLTVVDYTIPSYKKRLWIIDLKNDTVLMKLHVANGKNSGLLTAQRVSNRDGSLESSAGVFVTSNEYYGHHGLSMRVNGLEPGINNHARQRAIVIHSAWYVTPHFIKEYHRTGRSWGCFALNPQDKNQLLKYVKGGSVLFAYAKSESHDPVVDNGPITFA